MAFPAQDQGLQQQGLANILGGFQELEQQKQQERINSILQSPNASSLQKALAVKDNPKLAAEFLKQERLSQLGQHLRGLREDFRTPGFVPSDMQRSPQMQEEVQVTEEEGLFGGVPESKLQETMTLFPETAPAIKEELAGRRDREKLAEKRKEAQRKEFVEERSFATQQTKPYVERIEKIKDSLPTKQRALSLARNAIESDEVGKFSQNRIADIFGVPELKTAKGAELDIAIKENLISNLSRVSAKGTNLWLEKVMSTAFPRVGQSKEANLTVQEALEAEAAIDKAETEVFDKLSQDDIQKFGYIKPDIRSRVNKELAGLENEIMKRASYRTRELFENEKGYKKLENKPVVRGTPLTRGMFRHLVSDTGSIEKAFKRAKDLGYTIYSNEDVIKYEQ